MPFANMNMISLDDALLLFDKWKQENSPVTAFLTQPSSYGVALPAGQVGQFSRKMLRLIYPKGTDLRILLPEAQFTYLEVREFSLPPILRLGEPFDFAEGLRIHFPANGTQCLLLSSLSLED